MRAALLSLIFVCSAAQASVYQEVCGNANGTVQVKSGHGDEYVKVAKFTKDERGWQTTTAPELIEDAYYVAAPAIELEKEVNKRCEVTSWWYLRYSEIQIARYDGGAFNGDYVGLSEDKKTIQARVICEENGNGEWMECRNNAVGKASATRGPSFDK